MALQITRRQQEGISILQLKGRLTFGQEDMLLNDEIRHALAARRVHLVIDLGEVDKIDSAGLGTLLYARAELRRAGGGLGAGQPASGSHGSVAGGQARNRVRCLRQRTGRGQQLLPRAASAALRSAIGGYVAAPSAGARSSTRFLSRHISNCSITRSGRRSSASRTCGVTSVPHSVESGCTPSSTISSGRFSQQFECDQQVRESQLMHAGFAGQVLERFALQVAASVPGGSPTSMASITRSR